LGSAGDTKGTVTVVATVAAVAAVGWANTSSAATVLVTVGDEEGVGLYVSGLIEQKTGCGRAIPPGSSSLLIITLKILRHIVVNDIAHVGFVDTHAKGVGCHHDGLPVIQKVILISAALSLAKTGVITRRRKPGVTQLSAELLDGTTGGTVDDATRVASLPYEGEQRGRLVARALNSKMKVCTVKAGHKDEGGTQPQQFLNVGAHPLRGSCGVGTHHGAWIYAVDKARDVMIAGSEVVSPLRYAVRLIHRDKRNRHLSDKARKFWCAQTLGRNIKNAADASRHPPKNVRALR
jgi:hypothetical protein